MKSLEALNYLDDIAHGRKMDYDPHELKLLVEKELKALKIINKKAVNVNRVKQIIANGHPWHTYNFIQDTDRFLTQDEYDLLKEVLE